MAALAVVALLVAGPLATPGRADGAGPLAFSGTASLPKFPCPPADPTCVGEFDGVVSGQLGGTAPDTWEVTLATADLTADFVYEDQSCSEGAALGTATIEGQLPHVLGTFDGGPLPRTVVGITLEVDFTWVRHGPTAVLTLERATATLDVLGVGPVEVMTDGLGAATAAFAPLLDHENLPGCTPGNTHAPRLDAEVVGTGGLTGSA